MMWALANDLFQRGLTLNKMDQRRLLAGVLQGLDLPPGAKVLDFGCGTGLFANLFLSRGCRYFGYDLDQRLTDYAGRLYKQGIFHCQRDLISSLAPFDCVLSNCCFHHIGDRDLQREIDWIKGLLGAGKPFLLVDIVKPERPTSLLHRQFLRLEQGQYIRKAADYPRLLEKHFGDIKERRGRSAVLSLNWAANPFGNDMVYLTCR